LKQKSQLLTEGKKNNANESSTLQQQISKLTHDFEDAKFTSQRKQKELESEIETLKKENGKKKIILFYYFIILLFYYFIL